MAAYIWVSEDATDLEIEFIRPEHSPPVVFIGGLPMVKQGDVWRGPAQLVPGLNELTATGIDQALEFVISLSTAQSRGQGNQP